ncbi:PA14 domain-containing protein [Paenibacillus sp. FSL K6-2859]|uniref:PA14 domain-containing protein n=1 Tax=Paenibacillus sp. FSL K6-2859 TaxID=2921482 RepID=UPI0030F70EB9
MQPIFSQNLVGAAANNGLKGEYYNNVDLQGLKLTRTDSNVDFNWGLGSPHSSIGGVSFSVRWTGTLRPKLAGGRIEHIRYSDGAVVRYYYNRNGNVIRKIQ